MSIIPEQKFSGQITPASDKYPYGQARDISTPGDGTGTPLKAVWLNDLWGFLQALLLSAKLDPNGEPDTADNSQYLQALKLIVQATEILASKVKTVPKYPSEIATTQDVANGYYIDARRFGVVADKTTDYTDKIHDILAEIGADSTLYIPPGVNWDYRGVYNHLQDFQTIIDASGRDFPRNVWQTSIKYWHKTTSNTAATSGNTQTINGDWHPALFVDCWANEDEGKRASLIFAEKGNGKWQISSERTNHTPHCISISQYGSRIYGTKNISIGHQDGSAEGRMTFNTSLVEGTGDSFQYYKPFSVAAAEAMVMRYARPSSDTGDFINVYAYSNSAVFRQYLSRDGRVREIYKSGATITTTARAEMSGHLRKISPPTATISVADSTGGFITNYGLDSGYGMTLPKASPGLFFEFSVDAAHNMRVNPQGADFFVGQQQGEALQSSTVGSKLRIVAISNDAWSIEKVGDWEVVV